MQIPLRLIAGGQYAVRLNPRLCGASVFGWVFVTCVSGGGTLQLTDGGHDQPQTGDLQVAASGMICLALRSNSGRSVGFTINAGSAGLQGELHIEIFEGNSPSDPLAPSKSSLRGHSGDGK